MPCGVGWDSRQAFARARQGDPVSIFGGIIAFNRAVDAETASLLKEIFLEVVIAPGFTAEAREMLAAKKNLRLLECPNQRPQGRVLRSVSGGILVQQADDATLTGWQVAGNSSLPRAGGDGRLAWLAKYAKSNAIVVAENGMTVGLAVAACAASMPPTLPGGGRG